MTDETSQIDTLQELAKSRFDHALYRKNLRERVEGQLAVAHNGGLFKASPELISFLHCWTDDQLVIEDSYYNPIRVERTALLEKLKQAYQFALNAWEVEFTASKKIRKL